MADNLRLLCCLRAGSHGPELADVVADLVVRNPDGSLNWKHRCAIANFAGFGLVVLDPAIPAYRTLLTTLSI